MRPPPRAARARAKRYCLYGFGSSKRRGVPASTRAVLSAELAEAGCADGRALRPRAVLAGAFTRTRSPLVAFVRLVRERSGAGPRTGGRGGGSGLSQLTV